MRKQKYQRILLMVLAYLLLILPIGCIRSHPDFEDVITQSETASNQLNSYSVEMTVIFTENGQENHSRIHMEFVSPDSLHTVTEGDTGVSESIIIGRTEYLLNEGSDGWQIRQWPETYPLHNVIVATVESLGSLIELVDMADEEIDGVECYHYKGNVDWEAKIEEQKAGLDPSQPDYEEQLEAIEQLGRWESYSEFWIGKNDYFVRQLKQHQEGIFIRDAGEETEKEEHYSTTATYRFYDFNKSINIESPIDELVEGINLTFYSTNTIGGNDIQHQQIEYEIRISNRGTEIAKDVRVFIDSPATNQGWQTMETKSLKEQVNLGPNEYETYLISWEYDLSKSSKEELADLMEENVIRTTWIDENGQQQEVVNLLENQGGQ